MSDKTHTHRDLAALLGISETTIKSYRRKFPGCIPVANQGKPIRFTEAAAKVALRIRDLFETGMSVEEVRIRLAKEFAWIAPDAPAEPDEAIPTTRRVSKASAKGQEPGPELSLGISNMAKSMVSMTQQQKTLMGKMEAIEAMLLNLGLNGADGFAELVEKNAGRAQSLNDKIEGRLVLLEGSVKELAGAMRSLAHGLARFSEYGSTPAHLENDDYPGDSSGMPEEPTAVSQDSPVFDEEKTQNEEFPNSAGAISLHGEAIGAAETEIDIAYEEQAASTAEPPQEFWSLPMVVRTNEGRYVSAGGRGRGRFSVTDLQTLLSDANSPTRFSMRWEAHGQGWRLFLEQAHSEQVERAIMLLLMEMPTQKSGNVAEILKLRSEDTEMHPAEFAVLLERL
jgi:hypothetical protein